MILGIISFLTFFLYFSSLSVFPLYIDLFFIELSETLKIAAIGILQIEQALKASAVSISILLQPNFII